VSGDRSFSPPPAGERLAPDLGVGTVLSRLSALPRGGVLPETHPHADSASDALTPFPYARWTTDPTGAAPAGGPIRLAGRTVTAQVDVGRGGRLVSFGPADEVVPGRPSDVPVSDRLFARGLGLRGGVEWNPSSLQRSPFGLDPLPAVDMPSVLGGPRLRLREYERRSGWTFQLDIHVLDDVPALLVAVRQRRLSGQRHAAYATSLDAADVVLPGPDVEPLRWTGIQLAGRRIFFLPSERRTLENDDSGISIRRPPTEGTDCEEHWEVLALDDAACVSDLRLCGIRALAALDDPVPGADVSGSGWAALEVERRSRRGPAVELGATGCVPPAVLGQDELRWRHLLDDEGLGIRDRVNAADPGLAAGEDWEAELRRAHAREAMGDWRVHLRLGEWSFLHGEMAAAAERWEWANALRPTMWAERNLGLTAARRGQYNQAAVHYLRAHRMDPSDPELAVEAIGVLLAAGRAADTERVLDRMMLAGQAASAQYWLLAAECAGRQHDRSGRDRALESARGCADSVVFEGWAAAVAG
jgi:hypothetical protein